MPITPKVSVSTWDEMSREYPVPFVGVRVEYTDGLMGSNLLIMKENDVKVITDLMMGGDGTNTSSELSELHLSAISEAMNQMVGSSATSMSSMFDKRIDISPPKAFMMHIDDGQDYIVQDGSQIVVKIAFKMIIGNLIDSEIMQLLPISFAKSLVENLLNAGSSAASSAPVKEPPRQAAPPPARESRPQQNVYTQPAQPPQNNSYGGYDYNTNNMDANDGYAVHQEQRPRREPINVQPAQFQQFDENKITIEKKNISLIMDVPLQVTVELGRTQKMIKDILEFGPGSIIELDKLAGEPVDILVNSKIIAKGEVVVIDESFGVRITDIIHPSRRL